ncbi:MAG: hypothetical protein GXY77_06670 [Fibrobacter sp.]|nr:hypothetical protein [Fibrobacter sp.]
METRDEILEFLRENRELLKNHFYITKIGLFGSFARGEQTAQSDIDLIIELDAPDTDVHVLKNNIREFFISRFNRGVNLAREKYLRPYARDMILKEAIFV